MFWLYLGIAAARVRHELGPSQASGGLPGGFKYAYGRQMEGLLKAFNRLISLL